MDVQPTLELGNVDLAALQTEEDFRKAAKRLLPAALIQFGEQRGAKTWDALLTDRKRAPEGRPSSSPEDRARFVHEMGQTYRRQANDKDRTMLENLIVNQLKERKASG